MPFFLCLFHSSFSFFLFRLLAYRRIVFYFPLTFALFLAFDCLSLFSLKSHPTDASSLNMLCREHLWTANGFPSSLFSIVLFPLSLFALPFFLYFPFTLSPSLSSKNKKNSCLLFVRKCSRLLHSVLTHTRVFFTMPLLSSPCFVFFGIAAASLANYRGMV